MEKNSSSQVKNDASTPRWDLDPSRYFPLCLLPSHLHSCVSVGPEIQTLWVRTRKVDFIASKAFLSDLWLSPLYRLTLTMAPPPICPLTDPICPKSRNRTRSSKIIDANKKILKNIYKKLKKPGVSEHFGLQLVLMRQFIVAPRCSILLGRFRTCSGFIAMNDRILVRLLWRP